MFFENHLTVLEFKRSEI